MIIKELIDTIQGVNNITLNYLTPTTTEKAFEKVPIGCLDYLHKSILNMDVVNFCVSGNKLTVTVAKEPEKNEH